MVFLAAVIGLGWAVLDYMISNPLPYRDPEATTRCHDHAAKWSGERLAGAALLGGYRRIRPAATSMVNGPAFPPTPPVRVGNPALSCGLREVRQVSLPPLPAVVPLGSPRPA